jgi:two-component system response regulator HydG
MPSILVVDDDRAMVRTLCDIFRHRGWEAAEAYSGEDAIAAQRKRGYPRILMDIKLAGIDGVAAARAIKAITPDAHIVLMTAHLSRDALDEAARAGAVHVVTKPLDLPALFQLIE